MAKNKLTPGASQGGIQSSTSTGRDPKESGTPKAGISEAPSSELADFGPGKGIGNTRRGIH